MKTLHPLFVLILLLYCSCTDNKESSPADTAYKKGEKLYDHSNYDAAFTYLYQAYQGYLTEKKYTDASYSLIFLAIIQTEKGDFLGSNENLSKAARFAAKDEVLLTSIYNQFAINHNYLKNNNEAVYWYNKALLLTENTYSKLSIKNNIGISQLKMGKYSQAEHLFKEISLNPAIKDSINFRNRVLDNLAYSQFLSGTGPAENALLTVIESRKKNKDRFGMTASLSHLADLYLRDHPRKSYEFASAMYENAKKTGNSDDQVEALQKMMDASEEGNIKPLVDQYRKLNDSLENSKNRSKNQFTSVIYESEKNKAEILDSQNQILNQQIYLLTLITLVGLGVIAFFKWRKHQAHRKEIAVKDTQIKYSKKVHDVVANGLYHIMVEIENNPDLDKKNLLNGIEKLYEESRDIAKDGIDSVFPEEFSLRLYEMLVSYSSSHQRILVIGNTAQIWERMSAENQMEIFYVLRELMVNMRKHSQAKFASLIFEVLEEILHIKYTDNGIGMTSSGTSKKSGLQNMENRIEKLGGTFNFEPNHKGGLMIDILISNNGACLRKC